MKMQELWPFHVFDPPQHVDQIDNVVAIEGAKVADVHSLKEVLLMGDGALQGIVETDEAIAAGVVEIAFLSHPRRQFEAYAVVCVVSVEVDKIFFHAAYSAVYGHVVVVEHH